MAAFERRVPLHGRDLNDGNTHGHLNEHCTLITAEDLYGKDTMPPAYKFHLFSVMLW